MDKWFYGCISYSICGWHSFIRNDIPVLQEIKIWLSYQFSMKNLKEASYIFGMKIYRDRSKRLFGLSQSTYIDTVLKWFSIENFKKGYLPIGHGISLSKRDCLITPQERECMNRIPYALIVDFIIYTMTYTRPDVVYVGIRGLGHACVFQNFIF